MYAGRLRAIRVGHAELQQQPSGSGPVLALSSFLSSQPDEMDDAVHDRGAEVPQIRKWATAGGSHVTYVAIEGARHDAILSGAPQHATAPTTEHRHDWRMASSGRARVPAAMNPVTGLSLGRIAIGALARLFRSRRQALALDATANPQVRCTPCGSSAPARSPWEP